MSERPEVELFTDGACSGNPGPGGWAAILRMGERERELSGGDPATTNNKMELMGAITGLEALKRPCIVKLYTDSKEITGPGGGPLQVQAVDTKEVLENLSPEALAELETAIKHATARETATDVEDFD